MGFPSSTPVTGFSTRPAGKAACAELTGHVYGDCPPASLNVKENAVPTVAPGSDVLLVIVNPEATVSVNPFVAFTEALSVTRTVKLEVPAVVGAPVIAPVEALSVKPMGREPMVTDHW